MGKGDRVENYYVQQNDEWIPIDLKGGIKGISKKSSAEEYYIKLDGKWVKMAGINSAADLMAKMQISSAQGSSTIPVPASSVLQMPVDQTQAQILFAAAPQAPQEYHEYIITVKPPTDLVQDPVEPLPVPAGPRRIPRQPVAVPNDYADGPIAAQRAPVYREAPPAARRRPPRVRHDSPRRHHTPPPMRLPEPPGVEYREVIDSYAMGREAYYRSAASPDYAEYSDEDDGLGARSTPAPGYYLAGYIYHGDPSQPTPRLEPIATPGTVQVPPGHYLAGYTTGGGTIQ